MLVSPCSFSSKISDTPFHFRASCLTHGIALSDQLGGDAQPVAASRGPDDCVSLRLWSCRPAARVYSPRTFDSHAAAYRHGHWRAWAQIQGRRDARGRHPGYASAASIAYRVTHIVAHASLKVCGSGILCTRFALLSLSRVCRDCFASTDFKISDCCARASKRCGAEQGVTWAQSMYQHGNQLSSQSVHETGSAWWKILHYFPGERVSCRVFSDRD